MIIIFMYSAMKINANVPPLYSVLNPETSSDSPSEKSNGVRFVSARVVANHDIISMGSIKIGGVRCEVYISKRLSEYIIMRGDSRIRVILTSYEIVWATLRSAPSRAYFELEAQPAIKVV